MYSQFQTIHSKHALWRNRVSKKLGLAYGIPTVNVDIPLYYTNLTLPCDVESHPTPGDSGGSSSPSRSISGISSHVADGGSSRIPLECVQPYLSWSSSPSRSIHSPEHHIVFRHSCSHPVPKVALPPLTPVSIPV